MKLKLSPERGIAVLEVYEEVSMENVAVLRAGITKLFGSGKNKIIINLVDARHLAMDVIKEIVKLHLTATELKGQIVLVGQGELVLQAIRSFSVPPPVKYFTTKEGALGSLLDEAPKETQPSGQLTGSNAELKAQIEKLEAENKALKSKLDSRNAEEVRKLRLENSSLQQQLNVLEDQLRGLVKERKKPFEIESMQIRLQQLELALEGFLQKENLLAKQ